MMIFYGIIYKITNLINGKIYIGQTTQTLRKRWLQHLYNTKRDVYYPITKAINKYGLENFKIEEIDGANCLAELNYKEWLWICKLDTCLKSVGYNVKNGGNNQLFTQVTRLKISNTQRDRLGKAFNVYNKNTRELIGTWNNAIICGLELGLDRSCIGNCLNKRHISHMGYVFCYINECTNTVFKKVKRSFIVYKNTIELGIFHTQSECAKSLNIDARYINKCLKGKADCHKEYTFKYVTKR